MGDSVPSNCIRSLLRAQSVLHPGRPALLSVEGEALTYRSLLDLQSNMVRRLAELGIGRDDRVGIVLPDGLETAAAFLAISGAAACAPLNPAYRAEDFDFYLDDLKARALVLMSGRDSPARAVAAARGIPVLELQAGSAVSGCLELTSKRSAGAPRASRYAEPDDVALVLHTSGTTSRPKIVPLTHANLCASARQTAVTLGLTPADRCLNIMPLFHIHGLIGAMLSSITAGAAVICAPGFQDSRFFGWTERFRPTWYTAVPTIHQAILGQAPENQSVMAGHSFRFIRSCSSALPPRLMMDMERVFSTPVIEAYGMTEASHQMASNPLPPGVRKPGTVGPAAGPEISIMDEQGNLLEPGCEGEIVIRGPGVTRGYENNPAANAANFTQGWFRTGDRGCLDSDGYLSITGRIKELINRGGEKIAPREIDEVLLTHPSVLQAVAFGVPHTSLGEDIAAAVTPRRGARVDETELRRYAIERLPAFKVPSRIIVVAEIPKGPTGKIQRIGMAKRLEAVLAVTYESPAGDVEELVAAVFADVLGCDRVGRSDNFFSLGGDSIRGLQAIFRLQESAGIELPPAALFQFPTTAALAGEVRRLIDEGAAEEPGTDPDPSPADEPSRNSDDSTGGSS